MREIVTVCGSMRFYNQMLALANELTMQGKIVLLPFVLKVDDPGMDRKLQTLHREKIDMSSEVYIIAGRHYGASTQEEFAYAHDKKKTIYFMHDFPAVGGVGAWLKTTFAIVE